MPDGGAVMKTNLVRLLVLVSFGGSLAPSTSRGGTAPADSAGMLPDTLGAAERRALLYSRTGTEPAAEGMTPSLQFFHPRIPLGETRGPVELNTFQRTVVAADRGAYAGMFLGTLGTVMGWWDEDTAFYLMGAGAALGLVQGTAVEITTK